MSNKEIHKYDKNNNLIYFKDSKNRELWISYDKKGNSVYWKNSVGEEIWRKFDENNNEIHRKTSSGFEYWYKYDENNERINITKKEYKEIEYNKNIKEYNSRTKCSRFEIMEI